jgi:hypothetical protein
MPGGLLNLVAYGNQNIMLNGNPSKTFFTSTYSKYTNFGLQKFRLDFDGQRTLHMTQSSVFEFRVPRYADLLMDTYLVVNLPNIWSPVMPPNTTSNPIRPNWMPYEFKWIEHLGTQMVEKVRFLAGGHLIQEFTGQYLYNMVERDFSHEKKELFYEMSGHQPELNDPANSNGRVNVYPSAMIGVDNEISNSLGPEPSIRGRKVYIPLNVWFTLSSKLAFPLVSLQNVALTIEVTIRPIRDLFVIRNVTDTTNGGYYMRPDFSRWEYAFHRFLHPPPTLELLQNDYKDTRDIWDADVHLVSTYCFLSEDEVRIFASQPQSYLVKQIYQTKYHDIVGTRKIDLKSIGMITNWMWFFQRSDTYLRNEWTNYTNWPYNYLPYNVIEPHNRSTEETNSRAITYDGELYYADRNLDNTNTGILITGNYKEGNHKDIMLSWALLFDGKYRENELDAGVLKYIEKYTRTKGKGGQEGTYCYNFCLNTDPYDLQPNGAVNLSKFRQIEFEVKTYQPPLDPQAQFYTICDPITGETIGVNKSYWNIFDYTYDLTIIEERWNVLEFTSGLVGLKYARA